MSLYQYSYIVGVASSLVPRPRLPKLSAKDGLVSTDSSSMPSNFSSNIVEKPYTYGSFTCYTDVSSSIRPVINFVSQWLNVRQLIMRFSGSVPQRLVLKPEQWVAIEAIYNGRDVFVWLPTGFGNEYLLSGANLFLDNLDGGRHLLVSG